MSSLIMPMWISGPKCKVRRHLTLQSLSLTPYSDMHYLPNVKCLPPWKTFHLVQLFFTHSLQYHTVKKKEEEKRNVWDVQHESLGHLNCFLNMSLLPILKICCFFYKQNIIFSLQVKNYYYIFSISYKSQTERKNSRGRTWSNLCEKIVPMSNLSPAILPLEQIPTWLTSSVKRLWVKFIIFRQTVAFHWK